MAAATAPAPALFPGVGPRTENALTRGERNALVESCINLCRKIAHRAAGESPGMDVANLEGEALLACVEAARFWEPEGAAKFATFAQAYVQKRLRGMAADQKKEAAALRQANWDLIPDELDDDETEITEPTEEQEAILGALAEPMRTAVRQIVFEGLTPARVAAQMGVEVKDLKLSIRNAATALRRAKAHMSAPNLFAESV